MEKEMGTEQLVEIVGQVRDKTNGQAQADSGPHPIRRFVLKRIIRAKPVDKTSAAKPDKQNIFDDDGFEDDLPMDQEVDTQSEQMDLGDLDPTNVIQSPGIEIIDLKKPKKLTMPQAPVIMFKWGSTNKPFRCQVCDMVFTDGKLLRRHMDKHETYLNDSKKPFSCTLCLKSFQLKSSLERHQLVHLGNLKKKCKYCNKVFANKQNLEKHLLVHEERRECICPYCKEMFASRRIMETHLDLHFRQNHYICDICDRAFNRKDGLVRHLKSHDQNREKVHKCVECGKEFTFAFTLKRHVRCVHAGEPDGESCDVCGKFIKNRENLTRHKLIHEGKRPHICKECGRAFTQKQHLVDHMVIHSNERNFECKVCGFHFRHRRTLNRHLKRHYTQNSENCFNCAKCPMIFSELNDILDHITAIHSHLSCKKCEMDFQDEEELLYHMSKRHGVSLEMVGAKKNSHVNKATETEPTVQGVIHNVNDVDKNEIVHKENIGQVQVIETVDNNNITNGQGSLVQIKIENQELEVENGAALEESSAAQDIVWIENDGALGGHEVQANSEQVVYVVYADGSLQQLSGQGEVHMVPQTVTEVGNADNVYEQSGSEYIQTGFGNTENGSHDIQDHCQDNKNVIKLVAQSTSDQESVENELRVKSEAVAVANEEENAGVKITGMLENIGKEISYVADESELNTVENSVEGLNQHENDRSALIQTLIEYAQKIKEKELQENEDQSDTMVTTDGIQTGT